MEHLKVEETIAQLVSFFEEKGHDGLGYATLDGKVLIYENQPYALKFTSNDTQGVFYSSIASNAVNFQYSLDGKNWVSWPKQDGKNSSSTILFGTSENPSVYVRGKNPNGLNYSNGSGTYFHFTSATSQTVVEGNIMSLIDYEDRTITSLPNRCFYSLFTYNTAIISAENLILPAVTLGDYCYHSMFYGCTNLTNAPELPATSIGDYCYNSMFYGCTALTEAQTILPASTLASYCYSSMFEGCVSLTTAPELPAQTTTTYCYSQMFSGCTSLNYIKCLRTAYNNINTDTSNWVDGVSSTGTFVRASNTFNPGKNGIPSGWTIVDAS